MAKQIDIVLKLSSSLTGPVRDVENSFKRIFDSQADLLKQIMATNNALSGIQRATNQIDANARGGAKGWDAFKDSLVNAEVGVRAIEKISDGVVDGVKNAFDKIKDIGSNAFNFVKDRFKEAMEDQISDIQAQGSVYGSLTQAGLINEGSAGYTRAKGVYKILDREIGNAVAASTAPTEMIVGFSRTLSDNILPELVQPMIKSGKTLEESVGPAAKQLAQFYEQMALLTPAGYSPQMVSKGVQKALQGESLDKLARYDFFQLNPTLMNSLEKMGFDSAKTMKERIDIFQKALNTALTPEAIAEMRSTISGGVQSITDNLFNPTVGIFSFARTFNEKTETNFQKAFKEQAEIMLKNTKEQGRLILQGETLEQYVDRMDSPLKIIGASLGPFLQGMAGLFSSGGTLMGHIAVLFVKYLGPLFNALSANARVLAGNVETGKMNFAQALGRMTAEIFKQVSMLFNFDAMSADANNGVGRFLKDFWTGFESLGYTIDWDAIGGKIGKIVIDTLLLPGIRDMLLLLFAAFAAPSIISGISSALLLMLMAPLQAWVAASLIPMVTGAVTGLLSVIGAGLAAITAPMWGLIAVVVAIIALITVFAIRYREALSLFWEGVKQRASAVAQLFFNSFEQDMTRFITWIQRGLDAIVDFMRSLPLIGQWFGEGKSTIAEKGEAEQARLKERQVELEKQFVEGGAKVSQAMGQLGQAFGKDMASLGNVIQGGLAKVGSVFNVAMSGISSSMKSAVNFIDHLGGGVKATKSSVESASKASNNTTKQIEASGRMAASGSSKVVAAIKQCESTVKSSGGGMGMGGPLEAMGGGNSLASMPVTSMFRPGHAGIDFGVPSGTPVALNMAGRISTAAFTDGACGGMIAGTFADGTPFKFCHMSGINVQPGQEVGPGMVLGRSGGGKGERGAGRSSGPHIHFEPQNMNIAKRVMVRYKGLTSGCGCGSGGPTNSPLKNLVGAAKLESRMMPPKANLVMANSSETILTQKQAQAVDDFIGFSSHGSSSGTNVSITIKVIDPTDLTENMVSLIGRRVANGVANALSSNLSDSPARFIGV